MRELIAAMDAVADHTTAEILAGYFQVKKAGYGEGDRFIGLKVGQLRTIGKTYYCVPFDADAWLGLLRSPIHEHRLLCLIVMGQRASGGDADELTVIYDTYLANTVHINNWDLVDVSCAPVVGGYLMYRGRRPLNHLARSEVIWERRIAMVSTHHFIRAGDTVDTYRLATMLINDDHDLIHKAVGWMLREAGKRVDADELRRYLDRYATRMARTTLRYAIERFEPAERRHYLGLRRD